MRFWTILPTWAVAVFTAGMAVCFVVALIGVEGYGEDHFIFAVAIAWSALGLAELLRRSDWDGTSGHADKDADEAPPPYWP